MKSVLLASLVVCGIGFAIPNPLTKCYLKLQSETLCYDTQCSNWCNRQAGVSCDAYCKSFSTDTKQFVKGECTSLAGVAHKSVCKCFEKTEYGVSGPPRGPQGLAGAACQTAYMGQLLNGALKTLFVPGK